jgi:hypothetical protein|tara:strand:- start:1390 stop:1722 length:333 start_codon:yes stop_codon:yes gene_type:complete
MTTDNTKPAAAAEAPKTDAPAPGTGGAVDLTVQDLNTIRSIIDVASQRGAFKANEMQAVGTTYNKLETFLNQVAKAQEEAQKSGAPATGQAPASPKDAAEAMTGTPSGGQ